MNSLQRVPTWFWMLLSYAVLATAFLWAGNQPASTKSTSVFIGCLLVCWIPAFVYVNRKDIRQNRVFWASQAASLFAAAIVFGVITWISMDFQDRNVSDARQDGSPLAVIATIIAYFISNSISASLMKRTHSTVEFYVEKKLSPPAER